MLHTFCKIKVLYVILNFYATVYLNIYFVLGTVGRNGIILTESNRKSTLLSWLEVDSVFYGDINKNARLLRTSVSFLPIRSRRELDVFKWLVIR